MTGAADAFEERIGSRPDAVWFAPGRVNLIGEHTDHNDGFVLPFAIQEGVSVAVGRTTEQGVVRCWSTRFGAGEPVRLDDELPSPRVWQGGWRAYVVGAVSVLLDDAGIVVEDAPGLAIVVDADLQSGAGLSSSAALECAALAATAEVLGLAFLPERVAALGRRVENIVVGVPCGPMDQLASTFARADEALLIDCRDLSIHPVPLELAASPFAAMVIDTRVHHDLAAGGYAARRAECALAAEQLQVASLRDVEAATVEAATSLDDVSRRRARHVATENERVLEMAALLHAGDFDALGSLLDASHRSLRDDFEVSCVELDVAVDAARGAGAAGARMIGGGFGGSVLALVPRHRTASVAAAVREEYSARGWARPGVRTVVPADGLRPAR